MKILALLLISTSALAGGQQGGGHEGGHGEQSYGSHQPDIHGGSGYGVGGKGYGAGGNGYGAGGNGTGGNGYGAGGNGKVAVTMNSGTGSNNGYSFPVQAPPVIPYGTYWPCGGSFGASGSGGSGGGGFVLPWTFDDCVVHMNSHRMSELGKPKTACQVIANEYDDVGDAMKQMGESCTVVQQVSTSVPLTTVPVVATPALDAYDQQKKDSLFREKMSK